MEIISLRWLPTFTEGCYLEKIVWYIISKAIHQSFQCHLILLFNITSSREIQIKNILTHINYIVLDIECPEPTSMRKWMNKLCSIWKVNNNSGDFCLNDFTKKIQWRQIWRTCESLSSCSPFDPLLICCYCHTNCG